MKKILYTLLFCSIFAFATSCADHREDGLLPSKVYLVRNGVEVYSSTSDKTSATATAWATKSGLLPSECVVTYIVDELALAEYNEYNSTDYKMLPESCYAIGKTVFSLGSDDLNAEFAVTYNPSAIYALTGEYNVPQKYALPIRIKVDGLELVEDKSVVIMTFNISKPAEEAEND